jgi:hypothetical protein
VFGCEKGFERGLKVVKDATKMRKMAVKDSCRPQRSRQLWGKLYRRDFFGPFELYGSAESWLDPGSLSEKRTCTG